MAVTTRTWAIACGVALTALLASTACGGGGSSSTTATSPTTTTPTTPATTPTSTTTITISGNAVSPRNIVVKVGSQVTFVNSDSQPHEMDSDPHPEHTDCPAINQVGFLTPGQSRQTGNLTTARTCGFHDHNQPSVSALTGSITIQP